MRLALRLVAASAPCVVLGTAVPVAVADEGCGVGMYFDTQTQQCEPWVPVGFGVPAIPVPIPDFNVGLPSVGVGIGDVNVGLPRIDPAIGAPRLDAPGVAAPRLDAPRLDAPRVAAPAIHGGGRR